MSDNFQISVSGILDETTKHRQTDTWSLHNVSTLWTEWGREGEEKERGNCHNYSATCTKQTSLVCRVIFSCWYCTSKSSC